METNSELEWVPDLMIGLGVGERNKQYSNPVLVH